MATQNYVPPMSAQDSPRPAALWRLSQELRRRSAEVARKMMAAHSSSWQPLSAFWVALDRFRQVNVSFGHASGDLLLQTVAERLVRSAPEHAELLPLGGDEFVLLCAHLTVEGAMDTARQLLREVERPVALGEFTVRPSASIGVARLEPRDSAEHLLERADRAMLHAKRQGGNRLAMSGQDDLSNPMDSGQARRDLAIESALHAAIEAGGIGLHYQPIILQSGKVEAVEALMRCTVNDMTISPTDFIPVAERTGLIHRLGELSLVQGTRFAARLRDHGWSTRVAINVSRAQLLSRGLLPALYGSLSSANVSASLIELELTESLFMDHSGTVQENLRSIRDAGVGMVIDDFGSGYSCLASLKDLPATKLKFDREFIRVLPGDRRALAIVKSLSQLARDLGLTVVAEGVETNEQLIACEVAGTHATQGFFHSPPLPEEELLTWMKARKVVPSVRG